MPLPRPIGDPFAVKNEDPPTSTPSKRPISASAFSFHLGPKTTPDGVSWKPVTSRIGVKDATKERRGEPSTSVKECKVERNDWTPIRSRIQATPLREMTPMKKLDSLPSFSLRTPAPATNRVKVNDSPFAQPSTKRKLEDEKPMVPLNTTGVDLGEGIYIESVKRRVEEEGVGVSPRGKKIIKYHGKGPVPLSFILSNALSSQHSSLVLFYASLQNTLYPTRTPKKGRMTPSALTEGLYPKAPTIGQHVKTAPVVLRSGEVVVGRTGWSTMSYCQVIKGSLEQGVLGKGTIEKNEEGEVLMVFQPVPSECAKIGLDPRILSLKPGSKYEIGLWGPWSTSASMSSSEGQGEGEREGGAEREGEGEKEESKGTTVVFASRYLIAEL